MKKSQRLRLAHLNGTAEASRTAEEKLELTHLAALATLHPDATKDTDDTTPLSAAKPAEGSAKEGPTLRGFLANLRPRAAAGTELVTLRAQVGTLTTSLATANASLATAHGQIAAFSAFFGLTATELAAKKPAEVTALIEQKISASAAELVGGLGIPLANLPAQTKGEGGETFADKVAAFNAMAPGKDKDAYYKAHIAGEFEPKAAVRNN